jgi:beta-N-acetylhexosaminidase
MADIECDDLIPFARLIDAGLDAVMPAHVLYPAVDDQPAGYSRVWLQEVLRDMLRFDGLIFSDDLGMAGAKGAGSMRDRAALALDAGCDMVLVCNDLDGADALLDGWMIAPSPDLQRRVARMRAQR